MNLKSAKTFNLKYLILCYLVALNKLFFSKRDYKLIINSDK